MPVVLLMKTIALLEKYPVTSARYWVIPAVVFKGIPRMPFKGKGNVISCRIEILTPAHADRMWLYKAIIEFPL